MEPQHILYNSIKTIFWEDGGRQKIWKKKNVLVFANYFRLINIIVNLKTWYLS